MFAEIEETTKALCLGKREITFKIEIPHSNQYAIIHKDQKQTIVGNSYDLIESAQGGQCKNIRYRIVGYPKPHHYIQEPQILAASFGPVPLVTYQEEFWVSFSENYTFSNWLRTDKSLEEDIQECGTLKAWTLKIFDCNNNVVFQKIYEEEKPVIIQQINYQDPIFLTIPLWFITYGAMRKQEIVENDITKKCAVIWSSQPLNNNPVNNIKVPLLDPPIFGFQFTPKSWTLIDKFCSPSCSDKFPKISYSCDCKNQCPPNTVCSIQQGDQVFCLDKNGCVIESLDVGCIEPDFVC